MPYKPSPLSPAWKAYLDAFDCHLRARGDPETRIAMRLAFEFAMVSSDLGSILDPQEETPWYDDPEPKP